MNAFDYSDILDKYGEKNCKDIENEWYAHSDVQGEQSIEHKTFYTKGKTILFYIASGQRPWLLEHGSGSKMDDATENPSLPAYKSSEYWNNEREGTEIRTRPRLPMYKDLDNHEHKGSGVGMPHGINIEESQWHFHKNYKAIEPLHVMKQIVMGDTAMNKQMEDRILLYVGIDVENAIAEAMQ